MVLVGSAFTVAMIASVVAVPVADVVVAELQAPDAIALVVSADVPLATVCVIVAAAPGNVMVNPPLWKVPVTFMVPLKVCVAEKVWLRLVSAMVPVLAGRLAVTVPRAPVTVWSVTLPDVALLNANVPTELPAVPSVPPRAFQLPTTDP